MRKKRDIFYLVLFLLAIVALLAFVAQIPHAATVDFSEQGRIRDLRTADFTNQLYDLDKNWESWPHQILMPEELDTPGYVLPRDAYSSGDVQHATHRLTILLEAGQTYGIIIRSSDYAMRLFMDGEEIDSVGVPAATREDMVPRVLNRVYFFTPTEPEVTFVVQASNLVHAKDGGWPPHFTIGTYENVLQKHDYDLAISYLVFGCLLTAALYHLGLFCMNRSRRQVLVFALCCLLLSMFTKQFFFMRFPTYDWNVMFRLEYVVHFLTFILLTRFLQMLFPRLLNKWVAWTYHGIGAACILLSIVLDTRVISQIIGYFDYLSLAMIVYVLVRLAMGLRGGQLPNVLAFVGMLVICLLGIHDILYYRNLLVLPTLSGIYFTTPFGMVFFVFCYSLVLSLEYDRTERAVADARQREVAYIQENALLDQQNRMKTQFLADMSHEMKTPLSVMSGYAQLTRWQLKADSTDEETLENLTAISREAKRLGQLVEQLLHVSVETERSTQSGRVEPETLLQQTVALCAPLAQKQGNAIVTEVEADLPSLYADADMLLQVLVNLVMNACRHTKEGAVTISVRRMPGAKDAMSMLLFAVADTGTGIEPALLEHIFERHVSGDGRSGLGLAISREAVQSHGGTIWAQSELGEGTIISFTLPVGEEDR